MRRAFLPDLTPGTTHLPAEEAHHVAAVLRLRRGDELEVFDGRGRTGRAMIESVDRKAVTVRVTDVREMPTSPAIELTVAVAFPRPQRQGFLVEKCTELGVQTIIPVVTERSVARPSDKALDKWRRRVIEACKQCGRAMFPSITPPHDLTELASLDHFDRRMVATLAPNAASIIDTPPARRRGRWLLAVGPEGGLTGAEEEGLVSAGFKPVTLGDAILRTETAAVAACAIVMALSTGTAPGNDTGEAQP